MDELVIEDKKYLSSKKAAKMTGYAKDYVGQLCREGKVEARLVGRNWYVLETSIMDHRFGSVSDAKEDESSDASIPTPDTIEEPKNGLEYNWSSPVYTAESYSSLPIEVVPSQREVVENLPQLEELKSNTPQVLHDMQSAWQEWFDNQKEAEKLLPDASEMMLPEAEDVVAGEKNEEFVHITRENQTNTTEQQRDSEHLEKSAGETLIPIRHVVNNYPKEKEREEFIAISRRREERIVRPEYRSNIQNKMPSRAEKRAMTTRKSSKGIFLLKVTILSVAAIFMAITYLAFTSKDVAEGGEANTLVNFLTGVSTVESQK